MKTLGITIVAILLAVPATWAQSGCADCGAIVEPSVHCVPHCSQAISEVVEWGVVSDPVCVLRCRLLSSLLFPKDDQLGCDSLCEDPPRVRQRNRLMRKTLTHFVPVSEHVVAPICQNCQIQRVGIEPVPAPASAPDLAPLIDAADARARRNDLPLPNEVYWVTSDGVPTGASEESDLVGKWLGRLGLAAPVRAPMSRTAGGPTQSQPVQR